MAVATRAVAGGATAGTWSRHHVGSCDLVPGSQARRVEVTTPSEMPGHVARHSIPGAGRCRPRGCPSRCASAPEADGARATPIVDTLTMSQSISLGLTHHPARPAHRSDSLERGGSTGRADPDVGRDPPVEGERLPTHSDISDIPARAGAGIVAREADSFDPTEFCRGIEIEGVELVRTQQCAGAGVIPRSGLPI